MVETTILGGGSMGTAMALLLAPRTRRVQIWIRDPARAETVETDRENRRYLPGVRLPENVEVTGLAERALAETDLIIAAIPSAHLRATLQTLAPVVPESASVLSVVKGLEIDTGTRPSQILHDVLGPRSVAVLSGPGHAEELAAGLPSSQVVAGADPNLTGTIQEMLNSESLRIYTSLDLIGVELSAALKNVFGIAAGICQGLRLGDNAQAGLLTRSLVEMGRLVEALGGDRATVSGLAGIGDLLTTCYSRFGRNRSVGEAIGRGVPIEQATRTERGIAEGVTTARAIHQLAEAHGIEMPIVAEVRQILDQVKTPRQALRDLMMRQPKQEHEPQANVEPHEPLNTPIVPNAGP